MIIDAFIFFSRRSLFTAHLMDEKKGVGKNQAGSWEIPIWLMASS